MSGGLKTTPESGHYSVHRSLHVLVPLEGAKYKGQGVGLSSSVMGDGCFSLMSHCLMGIVGEALFSSMGWVSWRTTSPVIQHGFSSDEQCGAS